MRDLSTEMIQNRMVIKNEFDLEQIVYLKTDDEWLERIVTSIIVRPQGLIVYQLSQGIELSDHYGFEITTNKPI